LICIKVKQKHKKANCNVHMHLCGPSLCNYILRYGLSLYDQELSLFDHEINMKLDWKYNHLMDICRVLNFCVDQKFRWSTTFASNLELFEKINKNLSVRCQNLPVARYHQFYFINEINTKQNIDIRNQSLSAVGTKKSIHFF
jgi:hypothetical protein